jgi:hypothetical protein
LHVPGIYAAFPSLGPVPLVYLLDELRSQSVNWRRLKQDPADTRNAIIVIQVDCAKLLVERGCVTKPVSANGTLLLNNGVGEVGVIFLLRHMAPVTGQSAYIRHSLPLVAGHYSRIWGVIQTAKNRSYYGNNAPFT